MLVVVCIDTVSPHNLFYVSLFGFGGMTTRIDHYNITKKILTTVRTSSNLKLTRHYI